MTGRLLPFLSFFAAIGIFFAYINPLWDGKIADAKAAIAQDNQALDSAAAYTKRENELATEANTIDPAALARLTTFLPDSVDNVGLILDLNALADRSGFVLSSIDVANSGGGSALAVPAAAASGAAAPATLSATPGAPVTGVAATTGSTDPVGTIDLTISAKGTYDALMRFLGGVELSERLLDVRELSVTGSDTGVYTYELTLRLYWLR